MTSQSSVMSQPLFLSMTKYRETKNCSADHVHTNNDDLYHFIRVNKMIGGLYYIILSISKVFLPWPVDDTLYLHVIVYWHSLVVHHWGLLGLKDLNISLSYFVMQTN